MMNGTLPTVLEELGVTQGELAVAVDLSQATVNRKLRGHYDWSVVEARKVLDYLSERYEGEFGPELFGLES